eukprot:scaffold64733_cov62-Phaeocystis_antarctica.AAC.10
MGVFLSMSLSQGRSSNDVVTKNDESIVSGLVQEEAVERSIQFVKRTPKLDRYKHKLPILRRALSGWLVVPAYRPPSPPPCRGHGWMQGEVEATGFAQAPLTAPYVA